MTILNSIQNISFIEPVFQTNEDEYLTQIIEAKTPSFPLETPTTIFVMNKDQESDFKQHLNEPFLLRSVAFRRICEVITHQRSTTNDRFSVPLIIGSEKIGKTIFAKTIPAHFNLSFSNLYFPQIDEYSYVYIGDLEYFTNTTFEAIFGPDHVEAKFICCIDDPSNLCSCSNSCKTEFMNLFNKYSNGLFIFSSSCCVPLSSANVINVTLSPLRRRMSYLVKAICGSDIPGLANALPMFGHDPVLIRKVCKIVKSQSNIDMNMNVKQWISFINSVSGAKPTIVRRASEQSVGIYNDETVKPLLHGEALPSYLATFFFHPEIISEYYTGSKIGLINYSEMNFYAGIDHLSEELLDLMVHITHDNTLTSGTQILGSYFIETIAKLFYTRKPSHLWQLIGPNFFPSFSSQRAYHGMFSSHQTRNLSISIASSIIQRMSVAFDMKSRASRHFHSLSAPDIRLNTFYMNPKSEKGPDLILFCEARQEYADYLARRASMVAFMKDMGVSKIKSNDILKDRVNSSETSYVYFDFRVSSTEIADLSKRFADIACSTFWKNKDGTATFHVTRVISIRAISWCRFVDSLEPSFINDLDRSIHDALDKKQRFLENKYSSHRQEVHEGISYLKRKWKDIYDIVTGESIMTWVPQIYDEDMNDRTSYGTRGDPVTKRTYH